MDWLPTLDVSLKAWATGGATAAATVAALWNLRLVSHATRSQARAQQLANVPALYSRYLDHEIPAPKVVKPLRQLRVAPVAALRGHLKSRPDATRDWESFCEAQLDAGRWQQRFAYELSLSVQRVGLNAMSGGVPLDVVVADAARRFVEDWAICRPTIERIRAAPAWQLRHRHWWRWWHRSAPVDYHRRHGEWLVAVCSAVLLSNELEDGQLVRHALALPSDLPVEDVLAEARRRERTIRRLEGRMVARDARRAAKRLVRGKGWGV